MNKEDIHANIMAYLLSVAARACASSSLSRTYSSSAADLDDLDRAFVDEDMIDGGEFWDIHVIYIICTVSYVQSYRTWSHNPSCEYYG